MMGCAWQGFSRYTAYKQTLEKKTTNRPAYQTLTMFDILSAIEFTITLSYIVDGVTCQAVLLFPDLI
jgi:hypothetical protein